MTIKYFCDICGEEIIDEQPWIKVEVYTPPKTGRIIGDTTRKRAHIECVTSLDKLKRLTGDMNGTR